MRTISINSTPTHYLLRIERAILAEGPAKLSDDDQAVAVLVPIDDYQAFENWRSQQQRILPEMPSDFAREVEAFERIKNDLRSEYGGLAVAIHNGKVVASGTDKMAVLQQVIDNFGNISCYIEWVEPGSPRRVRLPSAWVMQ